MLLRILLVGDDSNDETLRNAFKCHSTHNLVTLGRVSHAVAGLCIERFIPDIVVVDADDDNGELLRLWDVIGNDRIALICVSAGVTHALDAFRAGAAHYLLKPLTDESVQSALSRSASKLHAYDLVQVNNGLMSVTPLMARSAQAPYQCKVIALPNSSSIQVRNSNEVVSAHGEGSYTRVVLKEEPPVILSRSLGELEPELKDVGLLRVHRSHMINLDHVRTVRRGKQPIVMLANGSEIDVGEKYKELLFSLLRINRPRK